MRESDFVCKKQDLNETIITEGGDLTKPPRPTEYIYRRALSAAIDLSDQTAL
jgi:hypothetical protein